MTPDCTARRRYCRPRRCFVAMRFWMKKEFREARIVSMIIDLPLELANYDVGLKTALHVGAHHGQQDSVYRQLGVDPIYVEANPEVFSVLKKTLPDRVCHNFAIADETGTIDLHVTSFDHSSSILPFKKHAEICPDMRHEKTITVPCITIDQLLSNQRSPMDLINLDIQGAELMALQGATRTLRTTKAILTEVNREELYAGCALIGDLDFFLRQFGFQRVQTSFKRGETWGDALYLKSKLIGHKRYWLAWKNWLEFRNCRRDQSSAA